MNKLLTFGLGILCGMVLYMLLISIFNNKNKY